VSSFLLAFDLPLIDTGIDTAPKPRCAWWSASTCWRRCSTPHPDTGCVYGHQERNPIKLISDFSNCFSLLWKDKLGQISLGVTTLFWGAAQTLQFIVLEWANRTLHLSYEQSTSLVGVVAIGVAAGRRDVGALRVAAQVADRDPGRHRHGRDCDEHDDGEFGQVAYPLLILVGLLGGFFLVPMNALLQHRGHVLMSAGHSIAVQNFNENLSILTMLACTR
jgi:hypothetical protein